MRYPDFYCVGAQKAGTSWLNAMLGTHPAIWVPPLKELHFFDRLYDVDRASWRKAQDHRISELASLAKLKLTKSGGISEDISHKISCLNLISRAELTDQWYGEIFANAPGNKICGEICPAYATISDAGVQHMLRLNADLRIIFIMRDPIDRMWSQLRMEESEGQFDSERYLLRIKNNKLLFNYSNYANTIDLYAKSIGMEKILLLYYDNIKDDSHKVLEETFRFLDVDPSRFFNKRANHPTNVGTVRALPPAAYIAMRERLEPVYRRLLELDNPIVTRWYRKHYCTPRADT